MNAVVLFRARHQSLRAAVEQTLYRPRPALSPEVVVDLVHPHAPVPTLGAGQGPFGALVAGVVLELVARHSFAAAEFAADSHAAAAGALVGGQQGGGEVVGAEFARD